VHFILHAHQRVRVAVGIKLVVQREYHAQRILRVRERLQVPRIFAQEIPLLRHFQTQIRNAIQLRYIRGILPRFARA